MSGFEFAASLVGSVAWPAAATLIALLFRHQLSELLSNVTRLRFGSIEIDVAKDVNRIEAALGSHELPEPAETRPRVPGPPETVWQELQDAASVAPEGAILGAWAQLEAAIIDAADRIGLDTDRGIRWALNAVTSFKAAPPPIVELTEAARRVRNAAAHPTRTARIDYATAYSYVEIAERLWEAWRKVASGHEEASP